MTMVGNRLDVVVDMRIEVLAGLPVIAAALNHVKEMRDHTRGHEGLARRLWARDRAPEETLRVFERENDSSRGVPEVRVPHGMQTGVPEVSSRAEPEV